MDPTRFDGFTRALADAIQRVTPRRGLLAVTAGLLGAGWWAGSDDTDARRRRKKNKKKNKKKRKCLFGQRRCRDRRCHGCCGNGDCGGNVCVNGTCSQCPAQQRLCRGGCIPDTSCCTDGECDGDKTCIDGTCACRADERLCAGACIPIETCCDSADCGGAACLNGVCQCPAGEQNCRGECIPETDCCRDSDCDPCQTCLDGTCVGGCPAGQECQNDVCACPAGQRLCGDACIPDTDCCTDADCGALFLCAQGTCVVGQGICPTGTNACEGASATCSSDPMAGCACFASTTGATRCGANVSLPGGDCGQCVNDQNCRHLYPDIPGVFCARGGSFCGCTSTFVGFCQAPCAS